MKLVAHFKGGAFGSVEEGLMIDDKGNYFVGGELPVLVDRVKSMDSAGELEWIEASPFSEANQSNGQTPPASANATPAESEVKADVKSKTTLIVAIAAVVVVIVIAVTAVVISNNMLAATEQREATSIEVPAEVVEETVPEPVEEPVVEPEPIPEPAEYTDEQITHQENEAMADAAFWGEIPADDWFPQEGFYAVYLAASQDLSAMGERLRDAYDRTGIMNGGVIVSSEWSNLNAQRWYCAAIGPFDNRFDADMALGAIQNAGFSDAYVKWSGPRR